MKFLTTETVIFINKVVARSSVRDFNLVDSGANAARNAVGDVFDLASSYLFSISQNQGFVDGNKRTAVVATDAFLRLNGVVLPAESMRQLIYPVAEGLMTREQAAQALREAR